ncbi:MAG: FHA domain-containing protein [Akkermansiaceae bacterium]|nr:FHA domain-containing protein [Akkermansiaceae bacterium]
MVVLEISAFPNHPARVVSITQDRTTIGRHRTNDIVVDSDIVSGTHARIERTDDGELSIEDLGSSNGTFVNDKRITRSPLTPGDTVRFGNIDARVTETDDSPDGDSEKSSIFGARAISQARQAMEKQKKGLPSGLSQPFKPESRVVGEAIQEEPSIGDVSDDGDRPKIESAEPALDFEEPEDAPPSDAPPGNETGPIEAETDTIEDRENPGDEWHLEIAELRRERDRLEAQLCQKAKKIEAFEEGLEEADRVRSEMEATISTLRDRLGEAVAERDDLRKSVKSLDRATNETEALRAELKALKQAHGEIEDARAQFKSIRQEHRRMQREIASYQPERARLQTELEGFLARVESEKAAASAERKKWARTLEAARKQLENLDQEASQARQREKTRVERTLAETLELERRRKAKADELARTEVQLAEAENRRKEAARTTEKLEASGRGIDSQIARNEKALNKIQAKIGRRKELLKRMKMVARREREVAKMIKEGKRYIEEAEARRALPNDRPQVQPWDIDRAVALRDKAIEEARIIQSEAELVKAALRKRQQELERLDAGQLRRQQLESAFSKEAEAPETDDPGGGETSQLTERLREVRRTLASAALPKGG